MNSINLIGNCGGFPEIKTFASGKRVARVSLAINTYGKDREPIWVNCELWDAAVERLTKCSVKKGTKLAVTGSIAMNEYTRTVGTASFKERKLYVKVSTFQVLSAKDQPPAAVDEPDDDGIKDDGESLDDDRILETVRFA